MLFLSCCFSLVTDAVSVSDVVVITDVSVDVVGDVDCGVII